MITLFRCINIYTSLLYTAGPDYIALTPMLVTFTSGEATASVNVLIVDDSSIESSEMFTATVTTTESNVMIGNDTANITILDVDGESLITVELCTSHNIYRKLFFHVIFWKNPAKECINGASYCACMGL